MRGIVSAALYPRTETPLPTDQAREKPTQSAEEIEKQVAAMLNGQKWRRARGNI